MVQAKKELQNKYCLFMYLVSMVTNAQIHNYKDTGLEDQYLTTAYKLLKM
jgi:hypothetical protein